MKAIITVGIPTSGKTTFATDLIKSDLSYITLSRDPIRREMFKYDCVRNQYNCTPENERLITNRLLEQIRDAHRDGKNIIFTDSNLRFKYIRSLLSFLEKLGYQVEIKMFKITFMESLRRNSNRVNPFSADVMKNFHDDYDVVNTSINNRYGSYIVQ